MFARIVALNAVPASGSVAAQTGSVIDLSTWGTVNLSVQQNTPTLNAAGTAYLYVTNLADSTGNPTGWTQYLSTNLGGGTSNGTIPNVICHKWGQVRWADNGSSAAGSLVTVVLAASDRGTIKP